jgi:hypothetical protein
VLGYLNSGQNDWSLDDRLERWRFWTTGDIEQQIEATIKRLDDADGLNRQLARGALVRIGRPAVPALIGALSDPHERVRWEAAEALASLPDARAATPLVYALEDPSISVRWAAARALVALDRLALPALLGALVLRFDSIWLRKGAHHVLHVLEQRERLNEREKQVYLTLHGVLPVVEDLPWLAEAALQALPRQ